ncbi:MAG: carbohydrate kinase [Ekhidna sp.]
MKAISYGEILWDIIDGNAHIGGAPLNFSAHLAQLGNQPSIISAIGNDELGVEALSKLRGLSVSTHLVQISDKKPTGTVKVSLNNGQPQYDIVTDVAYDHTAFDLINPALLAGFDILYFGTLIQRSEKSRNTLYRLLEKYSFTHIFCDLNLREGCYDAVSIKTTIQYCTILKLNDEEVIEVSRLMFGVSLSFSDFWKSIKVQFPSVEVMVITKGKDGCTAYTGIEEVNVSSEPCVVKDTIGAGDAFSATFLTAFLKGDDLEIALKKANKVGSFVASNEGAIPTFPNDLLNAIKL